MDITPSKLVVTTAPYAFAEVDKLVAELKSRGITPTDFGVGDPSAPYPDFVIEAGYEGMRKYATSGYPSYVGLGEYRASCAAYMRRRFGVDLNADTEITSTIGGKEAVFHFPFGVIDPGDIVIIPTPGYPPMTTGTRFAGGVPYFVGLFPENDFLIDYNSIPEDIARKAKILWLNYPNSPTGKTASLSYYRGLIDWAHRHDIIIAADEGCYIDIFYGNAAPHSILEVDREGIIAFYSLSKRNNMTGWRVGFVAGDERLIATFKKVKTNIDSGTPNFIQSGAIAALADETHVASMREEYAQKRDILLPALTSTGLPRPEIDATFYVWQRAWEGQTGVDLAKKLLADDIAVVATPGAWISTADSVTGRNPGEHYVRFALVPTVGDVSAAAARITEHLIA